MKFDHVLLIGFGGPTKPEEVKPFLEGVSRGTRIPEARLEEVLHHYGAIGGASPYNAQSLEIFRALEKRLNRGTASVPVFIGMRNWHPFLKDTLREIKKRELKRGIGLVLAPHRSDASFDKYLRNVEEAKQAASAENIQYEYPAPWHRHPFFIEAEACQVQEVLKTLSEVERGRTYWIFSAHSIPVEMAEKCRYDEEVRESARLVAQRLTQRNWSVAYQSRSGNPKEPWLGPDVLTRLRVLHGEGVRNVLFVPIGFICENAEILYDLDVEAGQEAEKLGVRYLRAPAVAGHPKLIDLFTELVRERNGAS